MLILTDDDIRADILAFEDRIQAAFDKMKELPKTAPSWKERKKLKDQRRALKSEIDHVRRMIGYALEALSD